MAFTPIVPSAEFLDAAVRPTAHAERLIGLAGAFDPPDALVTWLDRLQHLDGVPFVYLVPQPQLLPAESLRFFFVDPDWQDRVIDGAMASAAVSTADLDALFEKYRAAVRAELDARPGGADERLSGLLLRSSIVRHHPRLYVRAFARTDRTAQLPVVRQERLSSDVLLVMWAGVPARVELEEPSEGTWFGAERNGTNYVTPGDTADVGPGLDPVALPLRASARSAKVLDIKALRGLLGSTTTPSTLAWNLQNLPYRQVFQGQTDEGSGVVRPDIAFEGLRGLVDDLHGFELRPDGWGGSAFAHPARTPFVRPTRTPSR